MFNIFNLFKKKDSDIKFYIQEYPIRCISKNNIETTCNKCEYRGNTSCNCDKKFNTVKSSNIEQFVNTHKSYKGIKTYKEYLQKYLIKQKTKLAQEKKQLAQKKLLEAGAAYLSAKELCESLGLDVTKI